METCSHLFKFLQVPAKSQDLNQALIMKCYIQVDTWAYCAKEYSEAMLLTDKG